MAEQTVDEPAVAWEPSDPEPAAVQHRPDPKPPVVQPPPGLHHFVVDLNTLPVAEIAVHWLPLSFSPAAALPRGVSA